MGDDGEGSSHRHRTFRTSAFSRNLTSPVWNEKFQVPMKDPRKEILSLRVKSQGILRADTIATCVIPLNTVPLEEDFKKEFTLYNGNREAGQLLLQLCLSDDEVRKRQQANPSTRRSQQYAESGRLSSLAGDDYRSSLTEHNRQGPRVDRSSSAPSRDIANGRRMPAGALRGSLPDVFSYSSERSNINTGSHSHHRASASMGSRIRDSMISSGSENGRHSFSSTGSSEIAPPCTAGAQSTRPSKKVTKRFIDIPDDLDVGDKANSILAKMVGNMGGIAGNEDDEIDPLAVRRGKSHLMSQLDATPPKPIPQPSHEPKSGRSTTSSHSTESHANSFIQSSGPVRSSVSNRSKTIIQAEETADMLAKINLSKNVAQTPESDSSDDEDARAPHYIDNQADIANNLAVDDGPPPAYTAVKTTGQEQNETYYF